MIVDGKSDSGTGIELNGNNSLTDTELNGHSNSGTGVDIKGPITNGTINGESESGIGINIDKDGSVTGTELNGKGGDRSKDIVINNKGEKEGSKTIDEPGIKDKDKDTKATITDWIEQRNEVLSSLESGNAGLIADQRLGRIREDRDVIIDVCLQVDKQECESYLLDLEVPTQKILHK